MSELLNTDPFQITIFIFLLIILLSLIALIIFGDTKDKTYQKVIGGLVVFTVALISKHWIVIFTSLFIGGLIIASEKFLQSLAAILRTDGNVMPNTLAELNKSVDVSAASSEEVAIEKGKEEVHKDSDSNRLSLQQINLVEEKILKILSSKYKEHFTPNLKLENRYGQIVVDGAVHYSADAGKLNLENVLGLAEIKYLSKIDIFSFEFMVRRVLERIRYLFISKQMLIIFCAKKLTKEKALEVKNRLDSIYSKKSEEGDVVFGFVNINDDFSVEEIILPELKPHVNF